MKKLWHSIKYKRYARHRANRSFSRGLRLKHLQKASRRADQGIPRWERKGRNRLKHQPYENIWAPTMFSFVDNPEGVSAFIAHVDKCFHTRTPVHIVLLYVETLTYDGVAVLLSAMARFRANRIPFNGDFPHNLDARRIIAGSGFFESLYDTYQTAFREHDSYEPPGNDGVFARRMRRVDSELGARIIQAASRTVWGENRRCTGVQRTLIELMHNTNNHASPSEPGKLDWVLSVNHVQEDHKVAFSFVDYGVGVLRSLDYKPRGSKFFGAIGKLLSRFWPKIMHGGEPEILRLIFDGEMHLTVTGKDYRGRGLPGIYEAFKAGHFSDFVMITNGALYDSRNNTYRELSTPFSGTFIYWTLNPHNRSLPDAFTDTD